MRRVLPLRQLWIAAVAAGGLLGLGTVSVVLAQERPREDIGPFFDIDWSVGLRGSYSSNSLTGGEADAVVAPSITLTRKGERGETSLTSSGAFAVDSAGAVRVDELRLGAKSSYALDELSSLEGSTDLSLVQLKANDSSLPDNTATGPLEFTGSVAGSATRKFGLFDLTGRLRGERFIEGPTTLEDASVIDNSDQSSWLGEGGLRVGYELTPLVSVFVDASESYEAFDAPSPSLLKFLNGKTTTLSGGLSYTLKGTMSAEASVGRAWYDYDDPTITDAPGWVYNASVTFTPDETLSLTGALDTTLGPSDTAGDTDIDYALTGEARYEVNPWLALRGSASYDRTLTVGTGDVASGYSAGAGVDIASSRHTVWTADYLFSHDEPAADPASDTHKVTVGVTFKR